MEILRIPFNLFGFQAQHETYKGHMHQPNDAPGITGMILM